MQNYCIAVPFYDGKELCAVVAYDQFTSRVLYSEQFLKLLQSMGILKVFLTESFYKEVRKMAEINNAFTLEIAYAITNYLNNIEKEKNYENI